MLENYKILIAEDETVTRENLTEALSLLAKEVYSVKNGEEAFKLYLENL